MKLIRKPVYFFRRAAENIFENPFLNTVTIGIIAMTLFLLSSFLLVIHDLDDLFERWGRGIRVIAYLNENVEPAAREALVKKLRERPEVSAIEYVTKDEALKRFRNMLKGSEHVIEDLARDNPLPESLEVLLTSEHRRYQDMATFADWLKRQNSVSDVVYGQEWVERFSTALQVIKWIGSILGGLLILAAIFIVSNTIKLTLFARREELRIMQLVGATRAFIKIPFVIEGLLQGLVGAALGLLALFAGYHFLMARLQSGFGVSAFPFLEQNWLLAVLVGGMFLGAGGSLISLSRFLED